METKAGFDTGGGAVGPRGRVIRANEAIWIGTVRQILLSQRADAVLIRGRHCRIAHAQFKCGSLDLCPALCFWDDAICCQGCEALLRPGGGGLLPALKWASTCVLSQLSAGHGGVGAAVETSRHCRPAFICSPPSAW